MRFAAVPPENIAAELAVAVRQAVLGATAGLEAYCDLVEVCRAGGFRTTELANNDGHHLPEALLIPTAGGTFTIVVRRDDYQQRVNRQRSRFRIAHEIGHSFFYDRSLRPPKKLTDDSKNEERFCDKFAS